MAMTFSSPCPPTDLGILPEDELAVLRKLYGAKITAISAALGWACEAENHFETGDDQNLGICLRKVVSILVDA